MKKILFLIALFTLVGGVNSVKAETVKLYSPGITVINSGCAYNTETHLFTWNGTSNNTARFLEFEAGVLKKFATLHLYFDLKTDGGNIRILIGDGSNWKQCYYDYAEKGEKTIDITLGSTCTEEQLLTATEIRIAGNSTGDHSLEILPSDIYLETSWETMSIGSAADWNAFSWFVANGKTFDAELTSNISTSVMVGTSANPYSGTFDGNGYKLTVDYSTSEAYTAPFRYVSGATIENLTVDGTISSSATNIGGIVADMKGTTTINNCRSSVAITSSLANGESNSGGIAAINESNVSVSVTNCLFDGSINTTNKTKAYCGIIGYLRTPGDKGSLTVTNNLVLGTLTGAATGDGNNNENIVRSYAGPTKTNNYYQHQFASSTDGTEATAAKLASGEVTYGLQGSQITQYWGQNLKAVSSSPMLTSNEIYKVIKIGDSYYANQWNNTINDDIDWVTFSKLVASGSTTINVTLNANVDAGSTMVGTSSNPYAGTFNGNGHTITFTIDATEEIIAPFRYINGATIQNVKTTGTITSTTMKVGGIVGMTQGTSTIQNCASSMNMSSSYTENDVTIGGILGMGDNGANTTIEKCVYDGIIIVHHAASGIVGYFRGGDGASFTLRNLVFAGEITSTVDSKICNIYRDGGGSKTVENCYYVNQANGTATDGTQDFAKLRSGQLAYEFQGNSATQYWGQGYLNSSRSDEYPIFTFDASKKVYKENNNDYFANADGSLPDPALYHKLAWKMAMTWDPIYFVTLPAASAGDFNLYGSSDAYKLKVTSAGATTLVLPYDIYPLPDGIKAYNLSFVDEELTATPVNKITADKPVLINAEAGEYIFSTGIDFTTDIDFSTHTETTNGALTGVYNTYPFSYVPKDAYVLQYGEEGLGFYQVANANEIKITSFRAYLTAGGGARGFIGLDEMVTGINEVKVNKAAAKTGKIYNLNGQIVSKPSKGLYIVDGKVVSF